MGLVFLGEHTLLGRRAAIKTLLPTVAVNHEIVERFFNEARATSSIADPGVIQIFDFGYHVDGTAYIVMELLEGEALSARLERLGKLSLGDALRFTRQIAGSLAAAHARDIIHRDLKPENIFLVHDAEAQGGERTKIIDFGICKLGASDPMLTEVGAMIGTPVYMSPEQCRGSGEVDHRSDIYGFGCLMFHLLTGRPPFVGDASGDLIVAHLQQEPPRASHFVPEVPVEIDELLLQCMAKAPEDRFASMTALQAALGELAVQFDGVPTVASTPPPPMVPLGRGFRSMYDANLAAWLGGSPPGALATHPLRGRLHNLSTLPLTPETGAAGGPDDSEELEVPPSRAGIRAVLACVLVVGVVLGLIVTPLVLGGDEGVAAHAVQPAALPVEGEPAVAEPAVAEPAVAEPAVAEPAVVEPVVPAEASFASIARPAAEPAREAVASPPEAPADTAREPPRAAPPRSSREAPRASKSAPPPRSRASAEPSTPRASRSAPDVAPPRSTPTALARPITSPTELPVAASPAPSAPAAPSPPAATGSTGPAPAAPTPAAAPAVRPSSPAAASTGSSRPASPQPPPPTEDLYDTR